MRSKTTGLAAPRSLTIAAILVTAILGIGLITTYGETTNAAGSVPKVKILGKRFVKMGYGQSRVLVRTNKLIIRARCIDGAGPEEALVTEMRALSSGAVKFQGSTNVDVGSTFQTIQSQSNDHRESRVSDFDVLFPAGKAHRVHVTQSINAFGAKCMVRASVTNA